MPARPTIADLKSLIVSCNVSLESMRSQQNNPQIRELMLTIKARREVYEDLMTQENWRDHVGIWAPR